jgi:hypothetical protein
MIELRFIERIDESGTLRRILQTRDAAYAPWSDVPCLTLESQERDAREAAEDANVRDYS